MSRPIIVWPPSTSCESAFPMSCTIPAFLQISGSAGGRCCANASAM